jgi:4-amino-4-deoxy-L-arabinose transferase-like glycosyltransferase
MTKDGRWPTRRLIAVLVLAFAARLVAGYWWQGRLPAERRFYFGDSESYWQLGQSIYRGQPYQYGDADARIFRTPGFPLVLGLLFQLLGDDNPSVYWARAWMAAWGTLAVAGVMVLARAIFGAEVACLAGLLVAVSPESIPLGTFILSEAGFCPFMLLHLYCWLAARRREKGDGGARGARGASGAPATLTAASLPLHSIAWACAGGIAAGVAVLMRPSWLLFLPFAAVLEFCIAAPRRQVVLRSGAMFLAMCLTLTPWWIRNYQVCGRWVPTTLQVGASLYDGLSPTARGNSDMRFVPEYVAQLRADDARSPVIRGASFEERLDQRLKEDALAWARAHPWEVVRLAGNKFLRIWSPWPADQGMSGVLVRVVIAGTYLPLLGLALLGWFAVGWRKWEALLCVLPAVYFTLLHMIFVGSIRYRQPAMLTLAILAACGLAEWLRRRKSGHSVSAGNQPGVTPDG